MDHNLTTMGDTLDEVIINSASTITRLEQLVQESRWESVSAHLQTIQGREDAMKPNSTTCELLYHNLEFYKHAPFHVIEALVKAYPEGILEHAKNPQGIFKLRHSAIAIAVLGTKEKSASMVFKLFVETNPKCLDKCPVSFYYDAFDKCDTEVLKLMIQANPSFIYQKDSNYLGYGLPFGRLPIHLACSNAECEKINLLLAFDPSLALMVEEESKMFPLHLACQSSYSDSIFNMETFRRLIEAYPQAAKEKDAEECLPLHYACGAEFDTPHFQDFVSELLKIYPEATQIRDKLKYLPLHYMQKHFDFCQENANAMKIEKPLVELIEIYPDALLQSDGDDQLVLCELAISEYPLRQVWHTAGRLCTHAYICATQTTLQPLHLISYDLPDLVENFMECPLDWTKNEGEMQDGELAGIILHYTFDALLQANHGIDSKSNLPSSGNVVRPCLQVDNNCSTVKTTLLHQLAYCSKFCDQHHLEEAVHLYLARHNAHFYQADKEKMYPFMLAAIGKNANLSFTFSMLLIFVLYQNLDDLGSRILSSKIKR